MTGREVAWRVLAHEFRASSEEERGAGERVASYVISPLGARMNRVLLVGTLQPAERAGRDDANAFWRSRLSEPTGVVTVSAGSFQPRAQAELRRLTTPETSLVMGKVHLFKGTSGLAIGSIRAEAVRPIPDAEYRSILAEAALQTLERIELMDRLRGAPDRPDGEFLREGWSPTWIKGAREAARRYPTWDPVPYRASVAQVLDTLRGGTAGSAPSAAAAPPAATPPPAAGEVRITRIAPAPARVPATAEQKALEGRLLEVLDELAEGSPDGYADMDELAERATRQGIESERMEEILNRLEESGTIEEPIVGKFRRSIGSTDE